MTTQLDEPDWHTLLEAASAPAALWPGELEADLHRGRRRLARRRCLSVLGGAAVLAVVGTTFALAGPGHGTATVAVAPATGGATSATPSASTPSASTPSASTPSASTPSVRSSPSPRSSTSSVTAGLLDVPSLAATRVWRKQMATLIASYVSGNGTTVHYSDGFAGSTTSWGEKLGWTAPGGGQGMLQYDVGTDPDPCGLYSALACHRVTLANGRTALVGSSADKIEVRYRRPDGQTADVYVDRSFGNNGTTASSLSISSAELIALVQDPAFARPD